MDEKRDFSERLRAAMQARKLEPKGAVLFREFTLAWPSAHRISRQTVYKWLNGEAIPTQDKLQVLAQLLRLTPDELRYGTRVARELRVEDRRFEEALSYAERDTLHAFLRLAPDQRRLVREIIIELAKVSPG